MVDPFPKPQPLPGIEHVVVLMLENRSFDNVLGGLYPALTSQGLYRGLLGTESNPLDPADPTGSSVTVFQGPTDKAGIMPYPDAGEDYSDMVRQIFGSDCSVLPSGVLPPMSGFAWNYASQSPSREGNGWPSVYPVPGNIMQYYSGDAMPVSSCLARAYAVCDAWFAAAPVQTLSNRVFTHCGTPSLLSSDQARINNPNYTSGFTFPFFIPPVTDKTIFELLDDRYPDGRAPKCVNTEPPSVQLNWKVYYHDAPLSVLCKYVWDRWCVTSSFGGNVYQFVQGDDDSKPNNFEADIAAGLLPKYSFIEPRYSNTLGRPVNSNHPGGAALDLNDFNAASLPPPVDVMDGERLLWRLVSILLAYPETFDKTLLIVTYDEHGGLFDHVAPPPAKSPFPPGVVHSFEYDRYGVRVPAILINPRIPPGTVYPLRDPKGPRPIPLPDPPFDHTSILSTLIAQFGLADGLGPRVTSAPTLTGLVSAQSQTRPACLEPPPPPAPEPPHEPQLVTHVPEHARTLAGALTALYRVQQSAKPPSSSQ